MSWDEVRWNTPSGTLLPLTNGVDYSLVLQQPLCAAISCGAACSEFRGTPCARPAANPRFVWSRAHGWVLRVHGKGAKNRALPVPAKAVQATRAYFAVRGLVFDAAPAETPLLGALANPVAPIRYVALHQTFTRFVKRALASSRLPVAEREHAWRASTHWLRHTHATRAAERPVPLDVLQANLGHADPRTTSRYFRAQMRRRQEEMEKVFGDDEDLATA